MPHFQSLSMRRVGPARPFQDTAVANSDTGAEVLPVMTTAPAAMSPYRRVEKHDQGESNYAVSWRIGLPPIRLVHAIPAGGRDHPALPEAFASKTDSARFSFGRSTASTAAKNRETPSKAKPPCRFPVFLLITPRAYGPTKPPRLPIELIKAMPEAAEIPERNWLGTDQKGPRTLESPMTATDNRAT